MPVSAIRQRRQDLGLTQEAAARVAGISTRTWIRVEDGDASSSAMTMRKVAMALRWPPDALARIAAGEDPGDLPTVESVPSPGDPAADTIEQMARDIAVLRGRVAEQDETLAELVELSHRLLLAVESGDEPTA